MTINLQNQPQQVNILASNDYSADHLYDVYDESLAQTKCVMGVINSCAYYTMMNAYDMVKKTPLYRQLIKKTLNDAVSTYQSLEHRLRHGNSHNNHFFKAEATPDTPEDRHIPTDEELFDWWLDIGACAYKRYVNQAEMLRIQILQILTYKQVGKYKVEASYVWLAASLLDYASRAFDILMRELSQHYHFTFSRTFRDFSLEPVFSHWKKASELICPSPDDLSIPKFLHDNLRDAFRSFERAIIRDINTMDSADEAITQNKDLLDDKAYAEYRHNYDTAKAEYNQQH